jgi:transposase
MNLSCPKCGLPLECLFYDHEEPNPIHPFTLRYGRKDEPAFVCLNPKCPGMWTESSIRLYREMK